MTIGAGAVVAANAVVTRDVLPYISSAAARRVIRQRFPAALAEALLDLAWWTLPIDALDGIPFDDPQTAVEMLRQRRDLRSSAPVAAGSGRRELRQQRQVAQVLVAALMLLAGAHDFR